MSKEEDILYEHLHKIINVNGQNSIRNWRPKHLKNKKTNRNLEIDIYIGKFRSGFEYQGGVHFKNIKSFNNDSMKSRYNDNLKTELSLKSKREVNIVEVFEQDLKGDIHTNILNRISNTRDFYIKKHQFEKAKSLEFLRLFCFYKLRLGKHIIAKNKNYILQCNPHVGLLLDYKMLYKIDDFKIKER